MGVVMVIAGLVLVSVGAWRDITRSKRDKGPVGGHGGSFRSMSLGDLMSGLPFYLVGC